MPDWLVAIDDVMTERHRHCTACGRELTTGIRFSIWLTPAGAALACLLCVRCQQGETAGDAIVQAMHRRYGGDHHEEEYG